MSAICLTLVSMSTFAETSETISIEMNEVGHGEEDHEHPPKGFRMPVASTRCTIEFENLRIELSTSEIILTYELWDEDGITLMASFASDYEFVDFLSGLSGGYQLRLIGEDHVYIGYLEL